MSIVLRTLLLLGGSLAIAAAAAPVAAQTDFPSRPIKFVVPFPAGGGIDVTARVAAQGISQLLGQQIVRVAQSQAASPVQADQDRAAARFQEADLEAVGLHHPLNEVRPRHL